MSKETFEERGCTSGITKGRCILCNIIWTWPRGKGRLKDATCPNCGTHLRPTVHYCKSAEWRELPPRKGKNEPTDHQTHAS